MCVLRMPNKGMKTLGMLNVKRIIKYGGKTTSGLLHQQIEVKKEENKTKRG